MALTEKARRVLFFARYEAGQDNSPEVTMEHVLYGTLRENRKTSSLYQVMLENTEDKRHRDGKFLSGLREYLEQNEEVFERFPSIKEAVNALQVNASELTLAPDVEALFTKLEKAKKLMCLQDVVNELYGFTNS